MFYQQIDVSINFVYSRLRAERMTTNVKLESTYRR